MSAWTTRLRRDKPSLPRSGRGVLLVVGGFLVASAIIRFVEGPGVAFAREETVEVPEPTMNAVVSPPSITQQKLDELLERVLAREVAVTKREREVELRIAASEFAELRVSEALEELQAAEQALRATMALADEAAENDLIQLTAVYENMKPQQAGPLFSQMSPEFAAGFLGRMRPDAAAAIMAGLEPETAYAISVILAGRNANVPRLSSSQ